MKISLAHREFQFGWRDLCFGSGALMVAGGLYITLGWGILLAIFGAVLALVPFLRMESPSEESTA